MVACSVAPSLALTTEHDIMKTSASTMRMVLELRTFIFVIGCVVLDLLVVVVL